MKEAWTLSKSLRIPPSPKPKARPPIDTSIRPRVIVIHRVKGVANFTRHRAADQRSRQVCLDPLTGAPATLRAGSRAERERTGGRLVPPVRWLTDQTAGYTTSSPAARAHRLRCSLGQRRLGASSRVLASPPHPWRSPIFVVYPAVWSVTPKSRRGAGRRRVQRSIMNWARSPGPA